MSWLSDRWHDLWDPLSDALSDFDDYVFHGGFEDDLRRLGRKFDEYVIQPVYDWQKGFVNGLLDNPIEAIIQITLTATGMGWVIPLMNTTMTMFEKAVGFPGYEDVSWGDILKGAAKSYASQKLIGGFSAKFQGYADLVPETNFFLQDVLLEGAVEGFSASTTALVLGDSFSDAFLDPFLEASVPQLVGMGMGKVDELADGLSFETIDGEFKKLPTIVQDTIAGGINAKLQGQDLTEDIFTDAVANAIITSKAVGSVLNTILPEDLELILDENEISNQTLTFLTGGIQNAVSSALAGGTGDQAAAHILGSLEANGAAALSDFFDDTAIGEMANKGIDWVVDAVDSGIRFAGDTFAVGVKMIQGSWQAHKDAVDNLESLATPEFLSALEEANTKQTELLALHEAANAAIAGQQDLMVGINALQEGGTFELFATSAEMDDPTAAWQYNPRVYKKYNYTQEEYDAYIQENGTAPPYEVGQEVYRQVTTEYRDTLGNSYDDTEIDQWVSENQEWYDETYTALEDAGAIEIIGEEKVKRFILGTSDDLSNISGLDDTILVNAPAGTVQSSEDNFWNAQLMGKININSRNGYRNPIGATYNTQGPQSFTGTEWATSWTEASFAETTEFADLVGANAEATIAAFDDATAGYDAWAEDWSARTGFDATDIENYNSAWQDVVSTQETLGLDSDNFWNNFDDDIENINIAVATSMDENFDADWYFENYNMAEEGSNFTRSEAAQHYLSVGSKQNYFTNQDAYTAAIQSGAITAISNETTLGGQIPAVYNPKAVGKVSDAAYNQQSYDLASIVNGLGLGNAGFVSSQGSILPTNAGFGAVQVNLNINNPDIATNILRSLNAGGFDGTSASEEDIKYLISGNGGLNYGLRDIDTSIEDLERTKDTLQALNGSQKHNADGSITTWNFSPDIASIDNLLDTYVSFNNDSAKDWNNADTVLGEGVTWEDVIDGRTKQTFDVATGTYVLESAVPTSTMWDSTTGVRDIAGNSLENQRYTDPNAYLSNVNSLFSGDFGATMEEIIVYADSNNVTYIPSEVRQLAAARAEALQNTKDDESLSEPERREALLGLNNEYATVLNASAAVVKQYAGLKAYWERLTTSEGGAVDPELLARAEALETMATSYTTAELKAAREAMDKYIQNFGEFLKDPDTGEFLRDDLGNKIRRDFYVSEEGLEGKELLNAQANNSMLMVLGSYRAAPTSFAYDMLLQEILESAPAIAAGTAAGAAVGAQWGKILGIPGSAVGTAVGAAGGFVYSAGQRVYNIGKNLNAKKAALGIGAGTDVLFAMGAAYEGQSELVHKLVTEQYKAVEELSFVTNPPSMVRKYSDEQVAEIADRMAAEAGADSALRQGVTLSILMGMGKLAAEEALLGTSTGQNHVFNNMWELIGNRVVDTTTIALKEGATGGADEGLLALGDNIWINKNVDKDWELSESAFDAMWAGVFIEGTIGAGTSLVGGGSGVYINPNSEVAKDSNGLNNDLAGTGGSNVLLFNPFVSNALGQIKDKQASLEWDDETSLAAATGFLDSIGVAANDPSYSDFLNEVDDEGYYSSTEVADQFKVLGYTPTEAEIANFTGAKFDLGMPLTTAVTQYAAPYVILASDVTAAAQAAGLQVTTQEDIRALAGAFAAGITKEEAIAAITTQMEDNKLTGEEFKAYLVSDRGFTEEQAEAYYNANQATIDSTLSGATSSVIREGFTNLFTDTEQFLADNPSATPEELAQEEKIALLSASDIPQDSGGYRDILNGILGFNSYGNALPEPYTLEQVQARIDDETLTRQELEDALHNDFEVPRDTESMDAAVEAALAAGIKLGYQPRYGETAFGYQEGDAYTSRLATSNVYDYIQGLRTARAKDLTSAAGVPYNSSLPDLSIEELTTYIDRKAQQIDAEETDARTLDRYEAEGILTYNLGIPNVIPDPDGEGNIRNPELDRLIDTYFGDAGLLGVDDTVSANDRLQQGYEAAKEAHDAARVKFMEDNYGITPTPEQLERLRSATDTQWINDDEILQARRDLAAANNEKTLSPQELSRYLSDLGLSYNDDDGIYKAILGMGFTGEGGATFDADQRAAIAAEVNTLKAAYDAEQAAEAAAAELAAKRKAVSDTFDNTDYTPTPAEIDQFLDNTDGIAAFVQGKRDETAALFGDYNPSEEEITTYLNNNAGIVDFVQGKRNDTAALFGDYNPTSQEITDYLNNNAGIAQYVDDNTITQAEVKQSLEDQGFVIPEGFDYTQYTGKKPQANLDTATKAWRDANTVTETEVKLALEAEGFTVPDDFNYDAFTGKNKPDTGIKGQVDTYLEPRQYTRAEAKADLAAELGISVSAIDEEVYGTYLDQIVQLNGDTNADATGKTQVQSDITNVDDVRSYLQGLDYDTTGLTNEELLAFAGTGLNVDLGTVTSDYQTANETITQRDARLAAEAELADKAAEINAAMDDPNQDGGAFSGGAYDDIRNYYLYNPEGKAQYDALNTEDRKALVQRAVDNRRYSENEVAYDIRTAFPADADLSVEDLKTKYPTLFNLVGDGTYNHQERQEVAFDEGTITGDEANAYFRDVLGYGEGWIPTGNIANRLVGVGNEATVLPEDIANLTGETLDLYNQTTVTQDEVIAAMIANPTNFGFADEAAVAQAVSDGLDLSAYTGRYWQAGAEGSAGDTGKSLVDRLDDATVSQDEIDAYLTEQGYDPATAGTFDSSLGFGTTSVEDITSDYRSGVDADRAAAEAEAAEIQRQTDAINAALDDATQDGGAYTPATAKGT